MTNTSQPHQLPLSIARPIVERMKYAEAIARAADQQHQRDQQDLRDQRERAA